MSEQSTPTPDISQPLDAPVPDTAPPAQRAPLPPFSRESAEKKVQAAEDAWNTRDPERVAGAWLR